MAEQKKAEMEPGKIIEQVGHKNRTGLKERIQAAQGFPAQMRSKTGVKGIETYK